MFIFDFDDTLFDTDRYKQHRFSLLEPFGISADLAQTTYHDIRVSGQPYSNEKHARVLEGLGHPFTKVFEALEMADGEWLKQFVFPDTVSILTTVRSLSVPVVMVTLGDPAFQKSKIVSCGLESYFDNIYYSDRHKGVALKQALTDYPDHAPYWFINDKIKETQEMKALYPDLRTVLKQCVTFSPQEYKESGMPYFETVTDIYEYIQKHV